MKILLISRYFPPLEGIASLRMYCWAKYLVRMGHQVTILTTDKTGQPQTLEYDISSFEMVSLPYFDPVNYLINEEKKNLSATAKDSLKSKLTRFYRVRMNERMPSRIDPWIFPAKKWIRKKNQEKFDAIISSYGPPAVHIVGLEAKKHFQCPWLADYRDLWIENHCLGFWPFTILEKYLERKISHYVDGILTISEGLKQVFVEKYPYVQTHIIYNGFDPDLVKEIKGDAFSKSPKKFRMTYTGTLYEERNDLSSLIEAVRMMKASDENLGQKLEILFFGNAAPCFIHQLNQSGVSDILSYQGKIAHQDALNIQFSSNALILLDTEYHMKDRVMTGKVFEYLFAPPPIYGIGINSDSELGKLLTHSEKGILVDNKPESIQDAISEALLGEKKMQRNDEFIMQFSRQKQAEKVIAILKEVC